MTGHDTDRDHRAPEVRENQKIVPYGSAAMIEDAVTWDSIVTLITIAAAVGGVWWKLQSDIHSVSKELDAYKLEVAKNYATNQAITQVEERVVQAIERLGDRLDRFLENRPRTRT